MATEEKTISSEYIYKGKILNLRRDEVTVKGDRTAMREIVEHNGGVAIAALTAGGKIVLVKQFRKAAEKILLEIPAGKLDSRDEVPLEAAYRELLEETGYKADSLELLSVFYPSCGYSSERLSLFLAKDLVKGETDPDEDEDIDIVEMDLTEACRMCMQGEIEDGKTLVGILMAAERIREK